MFGYTIPLICELKVGEHNLYKSIYCGLCRSIRQNYSNFVAPFLSYDLVLFSIFAISFFNDKIEFEKQFCPLHPFKKKICLKQCKSLNIAADLTVLLSYFKIIDQINDEKLVKKIASKLILLLFKKHFKKASSKQPYFAKVVACFAQKQNEIEKTSAAVSIDAACHPTAECLSLIFEKLTCSENNNFKQFGYFLGRFIYLIDALNDLNSDFKLNSFNPFLKLQNLKKTKTTNTLCETTQNEIFEQAFYAINLTIGQLIRTYEKINLKKLKPLIDNVVFLGLFNSHKKIFKKHNKQLLFEQLINKKTT